MLFFLRTKTKVGQFYSHDSTEVT